MPKSVKGGRAALLRTWMLMVACGDPPVSPRVPTSALAEPQAVRRAEDPRLVRAREAITAGLADDELAATLASSSRSVDRRAARILATLARVEPSASATVPWQALSLRPPPLETADPPPPRHAAASGPRLDPESPSAPKPAPVEPSAVRGRPKVDGLSLRKTKTGAVLDLRADRELVVGIAHLPSQGSLRLVVDGSVARGALSARPGLDGARVTGIRQAGTSAFITLQLEPGWAVGGVDRTASGARVRLLRTSR